MSASDNSENKVQRRPEVVAGVSMRDLLAAGVAARVISTPPRVGDAETIRPNGRGQREAA